MKKGDQIYYFSLSGKRIDGEFLKTEDLGNDFKPKLCHFVKVDGRIKIVKDREIFREEAKA